MGIIWDKGIYFIENRTGSKLTLGSFELDRGSFGDKPVFSIDSDTIAHLAFSAQSEKDSRDGTRGYVQYGLPDGTVLMIRFGVPHKGEITLFVTFQGPRASQYSSDVTIEKRLPKGAGRRGWGTIVARTA